MAGVSLGHLCLYSHTWVQACMASLLVRPAKTYQEWACIEQLQRMYDCAVVLVHTMLMWHIQCRPGLCLPRSCQGEHNTGQLGG